MRKTDHAPFGRFNRDLVVTALAISRTRTPWFRAVGAAVNVRLVRGHENGLQQVPGATLECVEPAIMCPA